MNYNGPSPARIEFKKFYQPMIVIFLPCYVYAMLRYTWSHQEPLADLPFYLTNKVLGVTSVIMIGLAYVIAPMVRVSTSFKKYLGHRKYLGVGGFMLALAHGFMSFVLMTPANYKVFYNLETSRFNIQGSLSMMFGTIALFHFALLAIISLPPVMRTIHSKQWKMIQRGGMVALVISFFHVASFGYISWFDFNKWYGGFPPFSLVGASSILFLLLLRKVLFSWHDLKIKYYWRWEPSVSSINQS